MKRPLRDVIRLVPATVLVLMLVTACGIAPAAAPQEEPRPAAPPAAPAERRAEAVAPGASDPGPAAPPSVSSWQDLIVEHPAAQRPHARNRAEGPSRYAEPVERLTRSDRRDDAGASRPIPEPAGPDPRPAPLAAPPDTDAIAAQADLPPAEPPTPGPEDAVEPEESSPVEPPAPADPTQAQAGPDQEPEAPDQERESDGDAEATRPPTDRVHVAPDGDDDGEGSASDPLRTVAAALERAAPGATIELAPGRYEEELTVETPVRLVGAGPDEVTIVADAPAGDASGGVFNVRATATLTGFRLEVAPMEESAFAALALFGEAAGSTVSNLVVDHSRSDQALYGVSIYVDDVTVSGTEVVGGGTTRAGFLVHGASNVSVTDVVTEGHERGVDVRSGGGAIDGIEVAGAFAERNPMIVVLDEGGGLTDLRAPQFTHAVRHTGSAGAGGDRWFLREGEQEAIVSSLFDFGAADDGQAFVQALDRTDQSILLDRYVVGVADGASRGRPDEERANDVQTAIDVASANGGGTVTLLPGTYEGPITVPAGVRLVGAGGDSVVVGSAEPVLRGAGDWVDVRTEIR